MRSHQDSIAEARQRGLGASVDAGQPQQFEDGFTIRTVIGALFIAFIMMPGGMYLGLVAGQDLGPAAEWVTIVLFAEIARRSFMPLRRQELYVLFYTAAALAHLQLSSLGISGGPFGALIWEQYYIQSPQAADVAKDIPGWVVPAVGSRALLERTFFDAAWFMPFGLLVVGNILGRVSWISLGYILFRITSDTERLPFPMAPVAAGGATALAEAHTKEESWRWQVFSIGTMVGLVFGFFYLAIPIFTGVIFSAPLMLIPIPFIDFTRNTETFAPAAITGVSGDLGNILIGFVLPFQIVTGIAISAVMTQIVANPILQQHGFLPTWRYGMGTIESKLAVDLDVWMSVGIGFGIAVALIGIATCIKASIDFRSTSSGGRAAEYAIPEGRGDFPIALAAGAWFFATSISIFICHKLVPTFPFLILVGFGLFYSPIMSYVSARMYGLTGRPVGFPMVREATILKSGYPRVDIWFAPMPMYDHGWAAQRFREVELTGTKFTSILKAEAFTLPLILVASFLFWAFFWHTNPIPSPQFPFAQKFWPLHSTMRTIWITANLENGNQWLMDALKVPVIVWSGIAGLGLYAALATLKIPALYFYGLAGGVGALPHGAIPMFFGAMLGRYYFARRFGIKKWSMYAPVLLAGFACGMGLMSMSSIALALISRSVSYLPY